MRSALYEVAFRRGDPAPEHSKDSNSAYITRHDDLDKTVFDGAKSTCIGASAAVATKRSKIYAPYSSASCRRQTAWASNITFSSVRHGIASRNRYGCCYDVLARLEAGENWVFLCLMTVSKRLGSPYRSGRSPHWLKIKNPATPVVKREAEEDWGRTGH